MVSFGVNMKFHSAGINGITVHLNVKCYRRKCVYFAILTCQRPFIISHRGQGVETPTESTAKLSEFFVWQSTNLFCHYHFSTSQNVELDPVSHSIVSGLVRS